MSFFKSIEISNPLTAFGDLRIAELSPLFQESFEYTVDNTDLTVKIEVAGGTVTQANAMAVITTSTTTGSTAMLGSVQHAKYRPGLGGLLRFTALFTSPVASTEQYIGLTDKHGSARASGTVDLTGGGSGSVDGITVNSIEIMSGAENFDTDLTETARNIVTNINANTSTPDYTATHLGTLITITAKVRGTGSNTFTVASSTTTITTTDVNLSGGTANTTFSNGYVVGYNGTTFGFHRFHNDALVTVTQANWDDPMDGTGLSGMTLDQTKINVYAIQYQYLGAGAIRLFVESDTSGFFVLVHTIQYTNANTVPSVENPNFRFHMHVDNLATTSSLVMKSSSYAYFIEGKTNLIELHQPEHSTDVQEATSVTSRVAIFTIRNKALYNSKVNLIDILLMHFSSSIEANQANNLGNVALIKNTSLGGSPVYTDINTTDSVIEIDTAGTSTTGGEVLLGVTLAGKNDKVVENILNLKILLRPGDTITLAGTSANSATIDGEILWRELF